MGSLSLSDNKNVIDLKKYKAERTKKRKEEEQSRSVPTLMAFLPNEYYIHPELGRMIHVLFLTDKSVHFDEEAVYVMEDQYGNFFAEVVEEETCEGWHELHKDVFINAVEQNDLPDPPEPIAG